MNITPTNKPTLGAFGVVRTDSWVAPFIRLLTRSQVNHAFVLVRPLADTFIAVGSDGSMTRLHDWEVVEAQTSGAKLARLSKWALNDNVAFSAPLPAGVGDAVAYRARLLLGTPYNFLDIAALFFLLCGFRWGWLLDRAQRANRLECSQLVDRAYRNAGVHLFEDDRPDGEVTPGDLLMFIAQGLRPRFDHGKTYAPGGVTTA